MDKRHDKASDIMHNTFPLAVTHATPLSGEASWKFSDPTHQPWIPDTVSLPQLPQQEHRKRRGKGKGVKVRAEVSKQEVEKEQSRQVKPVQSWNWGRKCQIVNVLKEWDAVQDTVTVEGLIRTGRCEETFVPTDTFLYVWLRPLLIQIWMPHVNHWRMQNKSEGHDFEGVKL